LWDSNQVYKAADKSNYAIYKPTAVDGGKSFKELQATNAEVFAWLHVYGTNIDYPVTQGDDNMKYVNVNAEGLYSLSGSIFLNCYNNMDFSDFANIIYGHHMEKNAMFGEIGDFADKDKFERNRYGNLYYGEKDHGLEFFAFVHADAYDTSVFNPNVEDRDREEYLSNLLSKATNKRDVVIAPNESIVLLTTCSSDSTNGRDVLVGRIAGKTFAEPRAVAAEDKSNKIQMSVDSQSGFREIQAISLIALALALALVALEIAHTLAKRHMRRLGERENRNQDQET
jgi:sortase B